MSMITPEGGWDPRPQQEQGLQSGPRYAYDLSFAPPRRSWVEDLRTMDGTQARQLTFGAAFGATSGFYLARFLIGLLKFGVIVGAFAVLVFFASFRQHATSAETKAAVIPMSQREPDYNSILQEQNSIAISPNNPFSLEGNYSGWSMRKAAIAHRQFLNDQMQWEILNGR